MADQPAKKSVRRVKNPETFRERAIKAAETPDKPARATRVKNLGGKVASPVAKPVGKASSKVFALKPFRIIGKILRRPARIIGRIFVPLYVRNSWKELRLVTWPSWSESRRLTFAVIVFAVIFGATIAAVDYGLDKAFKEILLK